MSTVHALPISILILLRYFELWHETLESVINVPVTQQLRGVSRSQLEGVSCQRPAHHRHGQVYIYMHGHVYIYAYLPKMLKGYDSRPLRGRGIAGEIFSTQGAYGL